MGFLVTCVCGRRHPVTEGAAGTTSRCSCGRDVEVPALSELRTLPRGDPGPSEGITPRPNQDGGRGGGGGGDAELLEGVTTHPAAGAPVPFALPNAGGRPMRDTPPSILGCVAVTSLVCSILGCVGTVVSCSRYRQD